MNRLAVVFLVLFITTAAFAQEPEAANSKVRVEAFAAQEPFSLLLQNEGEGRKAEVFFLNAEIAGSIEVVKNAPFTATMTYESTQTLADGNRIINKSSSFQARDSQGRTRHERSFQKMGLLEVGGPQVVFIDDPVAHTNVVLMPAERTARVIKRDDTVEATAITARRKLEGMQRVRVTAGTEYGAEKRDVKHEDLGMQDVEGVACHGTRETVTIPAGQIGNEQPIVITTEIWTSDDLHGMVLKKHADPRYGETVNRLTNIKLGEPDASLFQVPSGYKSVKGDAMFGKE